jgi:hypothetical protein
MMRCFCAQPRKRKQINRKTEEQLLLDKNTQRQKLNILLLGKKNFAVQK